MSESKRDVVARAMTLESSYNTMIPWTIRAIITNASSNFMKCYKSFNKEEPVVIFHSHCLNVVVREINQPPVFFFFLNKNRAVSS